MKIIFPSSTELQLAGFSRANFVKGLRTKCFVSASSTIVIWLLLNSVGLQMPVALLLLLLICAPCGYLHVECRRVERSARQRHSDIDMATAVFLDLINVLLAGGAGIETAILAAATCGDGWGFAQIRLSIAKSQSSRSSYWEGLRQLGQSIGNDSLVDVANSVQLAGEHGARIRDSLSAKATTLRQKNLARIEHEAEERTEKMGLPIVLLFMGFILLIGYPAFVGTIGAL